MASSSSSPPPPSATSRPGNGKPHHISSRRLPPPCWTHVETSALIDAYRLKWYSLNRGNLKAPHWQEVADSVNRSCPHVYPSKTSLQCRHKVEKLRKRYRSEKQRSTPASALPSWPYFRKMDSMEVGAPSPNSDTTDDEDSEAIPIPNGSIGWNRSGRSRSAAAAPSAPPMMNMKKEAFDESPNFGSVKRPRAREGNSGTELVSAIRVLGEGFLRMERMKMEAVKEVERMRMEMEMRRTERILESQQRIVDAFLLGLGGERNGPDKISSPPD